MKANSTSLDHLDLNLLRVLDVLMQERRVATAAQRLGLSQPAVSNALGRLRKALGDELLTRAPNGMEPTEFAKKSSWKFAGRVCLDQPIASSQG